MTGISELYYKGQDINTFIRYKKKPIDLSSLKNNDQLTSLLKYAKLKLQTCTCTNTITGTVSDK